MKLEKLLHQFYILNNIPENGGIDEDFFNFPVFGLTLKLPNPEFRKQATYIHDIQHILNNCDTSWKGEAFIAGWEIATGMWKHFPVCLLSLWAMGYALWIYPKEVYKGYKKGVNNIGIIDIDISKKDFMKLEFKELETLTTKKKHTSMDLLQWMQFLLWCIVSEVILLFPLMAILTTIIFCF